MGTRNNQTVDDNKSRSRIEDRSGEIGDLSYHGSNHGDRYPYIINEKPLEHTITYQGVDIPVQVLSPTPDRVPTTLIIPHKEGNKMTEMSRLRFGFDSPDEVPHDKKNKGNYVPEEEVTPASASTDINAHTRESAQSEIYSDLTRLKTSTNIIPTEMNNDEKMTDSNSKLLWIIGIFIIFSYLYMNK